MPQLKYSQIPEDASFYGVSLGFAALAASGLYAAHHIEQMGHYITGMNNQIVWGLPHIFAIFLILSASGILNIAALHSVFGNVRYQPVARFSALLGVTLLSSGLAVLVLDLGRPDRLLIAMTYYNFKSIFAWNVFLYSGLLLLIAGYIWVMLDVRLQRFHRRVGLSVLLVRLTLTTGTGAIFGFLVAREAYYTAIFPPLFIVLSLTLGGAVFLLALVAVASWQRYVLNAELLQHLKSLLAVFSLGVFYLVCVYQLTHLYMTGKHGIVEFFLVSGGGYTGLFWGGYLVVGTVLPVLLIYMPYFQARMSATVAAAVFLILGGFALLYVLIIGGQAYPLEMFPNHDIVASRFFDAGVNRYVPSIWEWMLGVGSLGLAGLLTVLGLRILPFLGKLREG